MNAPNAAGPAPQRGRARSNAPTIEQVNDTPRGTTSKACPPARPYADSADAYLKLGWWPVPVLADDKAVVPTGFTGYNGKPVGPAEVRDWSERYADKNVALRLPPDVVALDVDDYDGKGGAATIAALEAEFGPLPPTVVATARPLPSGKRLYRVPVGSRFRGTAGPGVDIVSNGCRYVVAAPSVHHTGAPVQWLDELSGEPLDRLPELDDLPDLPWQWLERLSASGSGHVADPATTEAVTAWIVEHAEARRAGWLSHLVERTEAAIDAGGGRHPTMLRALCQAAREATAGAYAAGDAADRLGEAWDRATAGEGRGQEFGELLAWAVGQLAAPDAAERIDAIRERLGAPVDDPPPAGEPWPDHEPLDGGALPAFPVHALPRWAREYVEALATAIQVPADLPAVAFLGAVAAATTGRAAVRVGPGYAEPLVLWAVLVADPGERKSPTFARITAPLRQAEADLAAAGAAARTAAEVERNALTQRASAAESAAAKASAAELASALAAATAARADAEAVEVPAVFRLLADDATPEALLRIAAAQGGRISLLSAEPGPLADLGRRYSKNGAPNLDSYLKGWSAEPVTIDRVGRAGERIDRFCLSLVVCSQPHAVGALFADPDNRGRGVVARCLWAWPASTLGSRDADPPTVPPSFEEPYAARLGSLVRNLGASAGLVEVPLSEAARAAHVAFAAEIEPRLSPHSGDLAELDGWGSKLPGQVARIAGLLHVAEHGTAGEVSADTYAAAAEVGRYYTAHALRVWGDAGRLEALKGARRALAWLAGRVDPTARFTVRDVLRGAFGGGRDSTADDVRQHLELLAQHGYVRRCTLAAPTGPGRPSEVWEPRPELGGRS